jgi:DNA-binding transcriptional MerR regulator/methylmalonyl-CoA mutase cobalamin-binding subunit
MSESADLLVISDEPIYNAKAVTRQTGVTPATLRAWERRYGILLPDRTAGGHRLYSARDIAAIKWLREQIEQGLTISRAVALLQHQLGQEGAVPVAPVQVLTETPHPAHSLDTIRLNLYETLIEFDEFTAEEILSEAYSLHPIESVCLNVIQPALAQLGHDWAAGKITIAHEHFAANYLRRKLLALIDTGPSTRTGLIAIGAAPADMHEMGILLLSIFLRRRGWRVVYLGQSVPLEDLPRSLPKLNADVLVLSATVADSAQELRGIQAWLDQIPAAQRPAFAFGGPAFNQQPELIAAVPGMFLGETIQSGITSIEQLMNERKK